MDILNKKDSDLEQTLADMLNSPGLENSEEKFQNRLDIKTESFHV